MNNIMNTQDYGHLEF